MGNYFTNLDRRLTRVCLYKMTENDYLKFKICFFSSTKFKFGHIEISNIVHIFYLVYTSY